MNRRLFSLTLAFVMVVTLFSGMIPNARAEDTKTPDSLYFSFDSADFEEEQSSNASILSTFKIEMDGIVDANDDILQTKVNTGNQEVDRYLNYALSLEGKTKGYFGYTTAWCGYFINYCANRTELSNKFPTYSQCANGSEILTHIPDYGGHSFIFWSDMDEYGKTGVTYTSASNFEPRPGDIVVFRTSAYRYAHVAIVYEVTSSSIKVVHGNWNSKVTVGTSFSRTEWSTHGGVDYAIAGYARPDYTQSDTSAFCNVWFQKTNISGDEHITSGKTGDPLYLWFDLRGNNTGKLLNESVTLDYSVRMEIYNPSGELVYSDEYYRSDYNWIGIRASEPGIYKGVIIVTGQVNGSIYHDIQIIKQQPRDTVATFWTSKSEDPNAESCFWFTKNQNIYYHWKIYDRLTGSYVTTYDSTPFTVKINVYDHSDHHLLATGELANQDHNYACISCDKAYTLELEIIITFNDGRVGTGTILVYVATVPLFSSYTVGAPVITAPSIGGYMIAFDANGGECTATSTTTDGDGLLADLPEPVRDGYAFLGWYTDRTEGEKVNLSRIYTESMTLYAHWRLNGDVNNDGSVTPSDVILLRRYIAGGYGVIIDENAGDVNGDGVLTPTDIILIRRFIAGGYGVVLKPGKIY